MRDVAIFGCSPDTGNLGVSALGYSMIAALASRMEVHVSLFGHSSSKMRAVYPTGILPPTSFFDARFSNRFYDPRALGGIRLSARLGGLTPAARRLRRASAIIDISGGDSFTDMYGPKRFHFICMPKRIAVDMGRPLLLPPQTYGPFRERANRDVAAGLVRAASHAWARDARSFEVLKELLGDLFDPERHRSGVDVAFLLEVEEWDDLPEPISTWLADDRPVVGLNISGLIWNDPERARAKFGIKIDYRRVVVRLIKQFLSESDARVVLIPHVMAPDGHFESDPDACGAAMELLDKDAQQRVASAGDPGSPGRAKGLISKLDWLCGTRMHATIAGLSSGVPTATISYSPKARGVFESVGQGEWVADPSQESEDEIIDRVWRSWTSCLQVKESLDTCLPGVLEQANRQIDDMAAVCGG